MNSDCEKIKDQIADLVTGILLEAEVHVLEQHLNECSACRDYARALEDEDTLLTELFAKIDTDMTGRQERVLQAVNRSCLSKQTETLPIRRIIMSSPITKLAAAAIIIAVLIGIDQFGSSGKGVAWGNVAEKVEKIQTYIFRERQTETSEPIQEGFEFVTESESIHHWSLEYGSRIDTYKNGELAISTYTLPAEKAMVGIVYPMKMYSRRALSEATIREMEQKGPREIIRQLMSADYKLLGHEVIGGIEVEGIEFNDPNALYYTGPPIRDFAGRLWVDVKDELPVWIELKFVPQGSPIHHRIVMDQFQWNVELDASDFEPNIPADYVLEEGQRQQTAQQQKLLALEEPAFPLMDLPDVSSLTLLGLEDSMPETITPLVGYMEVWKVQDRIVSTWPAYSEVEQRLYQELQAKLDIENLSSEQLMATAVALREKFWDKGGRLSQTSYPYGYAARILLEIADDINPENMTVTDELVETMQTIELFWSFKPDSDERIKNMELRTRLKRIRGEQFEQIKQELETGRELKWQDFFRVNDLAILCGWTKDFEQGLNIVVWLIEHAEPGGWTAYLQPLGNMQNNFSKGEKFNYNILLATGTEFPEGYRYHGLPSFKGPRKRAAKPVHILDPNPVWHGN